MASTPFRLSNHIIETLRSLAKESRLTMSDWIRDRVEREVGLCGGEPFTLPSQPSLYRDIRVFLQQSGPMARDSMRAKILEGLDEHAYTFDEVGLDKLTPLHWAARGEADLELVAALIEAGHPISPEDGYGNTPLVLAITEQNSATESNLSVIEYLLERTRARELFPQATQFLHGDGMYDFALARGMFRTASCIRERFKRVNLEAMLHDLPAWYLPTRCARILYYQGVPWPDVFRIMVARGIEEDRAKLEMRSLGVWIKYLEELELQGLKEEKVIQALRELGAAWSDLAWAYIKNGYPPEAVLKLLLPMAPCETHVEVVANALSVSEHTPLLDARDALEALGMDPRAIVRKTPFTEERKASLLKRMRLS